MPEDNNKMEGMPGIMRMMKAISERKPSSKWKLPQDLEWQLATVREKLGNMSPKSHMQSIAKRYYDALDDVKEANHKDDLSVTVDKIIGLLTEEHKKAADEWDYAFKVQHGALVSFFKNTLRGGANVFKSTSNFTPVKTALEDLGDFVNNSNGYFIKGQDTSRTETMLQSKSNEVKKVLQTYLEHKYTDMGSFIVDRKNISELFLPNNWTLAWLVAKVAGIKYEGNTVASERPEKKPTYDRKFGRGYLGHLFSKLYDLYK